MTIINRHLVMYERGGYILCAIVTRESTEAQWDYGIEQKSPSLEMALEVSCFVLGVEMSMSHEICSHSLCGWAQSMAWLIHKGHPFGIIIPHFHLHAGKTGPDIQRKLILLAQTGKQNRLLKTEDICCKSQFTHSVFDILCKGNQVFTSRMLI